MFVSFVSILFCFFLCDVVWCTGHFGRSNREERSHHVFLLGSVYCVRHFGRTVIGGRRAGDPRQFRLPQERRCGWHRPVKLRRTSSAALFLKTHKQTNTVMIIHSSLSKQIIAFISTFMSRRGLVGVRRPITVDYFKDR